MSIESIAPVPLSPARDSGSPASGPGAARSTWIVGPWFDGAFFIFPVVFAAIYVWINYANAGNQTVANLLNTLLVAFGVFHFGGTIFFYFDRENLSHFKAHPVRFYWIPAGLIVLGATLVMGEFFLARHYRFSDWNVASALIYVWVSYHLTKQNIGFTNIYRMRAGIASLTERRIDNALIFANAGLFYFAGWYYSDQLSFLPFLRLPALKYVTYLLVGILVVCAAVALVARIRTLVASRGRSWPHVAMLAVSLLFPLPMAMAFYETTPSLLMYSNSQFGLFAHYVQYVAITSLLHHHKYHMAGESERRLVFGRVPLNGLSLMLLFSLVVTVLFVGFSEFARVARVEVLQAVAASTMVSLSILHYYLDGELWAFRREHNRKAILPYLKPFRTGP